MAPSRRPRKRNTRMDAAVDAMQPLGYSERLVCQTVNELLDVYGKEGWPFIEEYYYHVLIEALLEKQEKNVQEKLSVFSSGFLSKCAYPSPQHEANAGEDIETSAVGPSSATQTIQPLDNGISTKESATQESIPPAAGEYNNPGDTLNQRSKEKDSNPTQGRKPYYGWLGLEPDEKDFIELAPPPTPVELLTLLFEKYGNETSKSRWDVRPEDM